MFRHHFDVQILQIVVEHYSIDIEEFYPYLWKCWFETPKDIPVELLPRNQRISEDAALGNLWKHMPIKLIYRWSIVFFSDTLLYWIGTTFLGDDSWGDLYARLQPLLEQKSLSVSDITNDMWRATN